MRPDDTEPGAVDHHQPGGIQQPGQRQEPGEALKPTRPIPPARRTHRTAAELSRPRRLKDLGIDILVSLREPAESEALGLLRTESL